jgi:hypothetical protein
MLKEMRTRATNPSKSIMDETMGAHCGLSSISSHSGSFEPLLYISSGERECQEEMGYNIISFT